MSIYMTFEDWCHEEQAIYRTIETKEDLYDVVKQTWNAAISSAIKSVGAVTGDNTKELKALISLLTK